jgi:hypothetical protein
LYKLLLFLNKTNDEGIINHFEENTLKYLSDLTGGEKIESADVESNLLLPLKFSRFCEVSISSKEEWDMKMNSKEGRELSKHLMDFHQHITAIFVNYSKTSQINKKYV